MNRNLSKCLEEIIEKKEEKKEKGFDDKNRDDNCNIV